MTGISTFAAEKNAKNVPLEVLGATDSSGQLNYSVKFASEKEPRMVSSETMKNEHAMELIKFIEQHIIWHDNQ